MAETTQERTPAEQPTERDIFRFHDGTRQRAMDPLKIWTAMWSDENIDVAKLLDRMSHNELESVNELIASARTWLKVPDYNEDDNTGMTDLEFCQVMYQWFEYVIQLKKKLGQLPIPLRLSLPLSPGSPSATKTSSDSSSTENESPGAEPTTASKPSPAPSVEA
jgi:hypothetical protein